MSKIKKSFIKFILLILRVSARIQIKKIKPIIIGIGGSSGKSSTTLILSQIIKGSASVKQSGGKNSETGIPLNILNIKLENYSHLTWLRVLFLIPFHLLFDWRKYKFYIVEMGIDSPFAPKNMSYLLKIVKPSVGIVTNVSYEHSLNFDVLVKEENLRERMEKIMELTAAEELSLLESLNNENIAVVNLDDKEIKEILPSLKSKVISVSMEDKKADFYVKSLSLSLKDFGMSFKNQEKEYNLKINRPLPKHYIYSIILSIAAASNFMKIEDIIGHISKNFSLPPGRFSIFEGINESKIIDSSYNNATLEPIFDILDFMKTVGIENRKLGIIGDMRELGSITEVNHQGLAKKISETLDEVILIGPMLEKYATPILRDHHFNFRSFKTFSDAKYYIHRAVQKDDLVLVKGSQNTLLLERAVQMLLVNPLDKDKLCRRGKYWEYMRTKTP